MLEGGFCRVLSINAPGVLRCVSDDVSNLPQAANDQQPQAAGARALWAADARTAGSLLSPAPMVFAYQRE